MFKNKKIVILSWIVVFIWMLMIFNLSSQVREESNNLSKGITEIVIGTIEKISPDADFDMDKFNHIIRKNAHFFAYLVLGILMFNAMRRSGVDGVRWALLICVIYAISDEVHQLFVNGRGPQVKDVFIDSAGAVVGIGIYVVISRIKKRWLI